MRSCRRSFFAAWALLPVLAAPAFAFTPHADHQGLQFPLAYEATPLVYKTVNPGDLPTTARAAGLQNWVLQENPRTRLVHAAYGGNAQVASAITSEAQATSVAKDWLLTHRSVLGVNDNNMKLQYVKFHRDRYAVHYRQMHN